MQNFVMAECCVSCCHNCSHLSGKTMHRDPIISCASRSKHFASAIFCMLDNVNFFSTVIWVGAYNSVVGCGTVLQTRSS
jgi:hypothetical protein